MRNTKDSSLDGSDNCGWVDFVQWTGPSPAQDPNNWDTITYKYDTSGRRIEKRIDDKTSMRYIYDGNNVIAEYDGNNNLTRKYIHGARVDEPVCMIDVVDSNAVYYYHYDGLGSVVAKRTYPNNRLYCGRLQRPMTALSVQKCSQSSLGYACDPF